MMMLNDATRGPATHSMPTGLSVTPTAASANANANRRPRAQSMQQFSDKSSSSLGSPSARDCSSSGSFVSKLFRMVDSEPSSIVSWTRGGTAFCIVDPKMMAEHCLPKYFRHRRFSSLIRQLNFYSFYRVQEGQLAIYQHSFFRKGRPDLLVHIKRRGAGKAKDPWFDPLATTPSSAAATPPLPSASHTSNTSNSATNKSAAAMMSSAPTNPSLNLNVINVSTMTPSNGMMCYSPMSKPVMMENMSPALKPGMAPNAPPPMMDMGTSMLGAAATSDELMLASKQPQFQRWDAHKEHEPQSFGLASPMPLKHKFLYMDTAMNNTHSPMLRASEYNSSSSMSMPTPLDLDIQDFLTEDCSINTSCVSEMKSQFDDRLCSSSLQHAKHAMVSRDLLKWDTKCEADVPSSHVSGLMASSSSTDVDSSGGTFEDELLLDLANVEPDAWEVPLSPLNEDEDMMPWLDLCF